MVISREQFNDYESRMESRLYRSLDAIAEDEITEEGINIGLDAIDRITGGLRAGRLNLYVGYTSHGKTAGMLTTIVNNLDDLCCLFITGDDTDHEILSKILAMSHGITTDDVRRHGAEWRRKQVRDLSDRLFIAAPQKGSYSIDSLAVIVDRAMSLFGQVPDLIGFDYLTLLTQNSEDTNVFSNVRKQVLGFKQLIRTFPEATYMVGHQCNRGVLTYQGPLMTNHIEAGGVAETDGVIVGFRRKIDTERLTEEQVYEEAEFPTVNVSVLKNKVTGRRSPNPIGVVYAIDPISGKLRERTPEEKRGKVASLADARNRQFTMAHRFDGYQT